MLMCRGGVFRSNHHVDMLEDQLSKIMCKVSKIKAIPITCRGGLLGCEMLRIPHCLDSRLTVNCEILATCSSTYSPARTSQEAHSVSVK
jgi:hypothetical protein